MTIMKAYIQKLFIEVQKNGNFESQKDFRVLRKVIFKF